MPRYTFNFELIKPCNNYCKQERNKGSNFDEKGFKPEGKTGFGIIEYTVIVHVQFKKTIGEKTIIKEQV